MGAVSFLLSAVLSTFKLHFEPTGAATSALPTLLVTSPAENSIDLERGNMT